MTLTVLDIERWDAGDVREVFHAATSRAQAAMDAADGLARLPAFESWGGEAAEAAREAIGQTRKDLDAHGNEALAVANAARSAADEIDRIKSDLATLRADAEALGMEIDPIAGTVLPGPKVRNPMEAELKQAQLQPRLDKIVAEANLVDMALANAINMAGGKTPIPVTPHDNRPEIQDALNKPLPEDPNEFRDLWTQLTPEEKDWLYSRDHNIGNHPGMPWAGDHSNPGKDYYNRLHLPELQQNAQAEVDRLEALHPEWAAGHPPNRSTYDQWRAWRSKLDAAEHTLDGYNSVSSTLSPNDGIPRYLGLIDDQGHAAIAMGNPDTATRTATLVPGTGQDLSAFQGATDKSGAMYNAAVQADKSLRDHLAVMTWMGYDRPMDLGQAADDVYARGGAGALDSFLTGNQASHVGPTSIDTVVGHSYGSTLVGAAGADGHHLAAENVIAVGSPGMLVGNAHDLSLDPGGQVYAARAQHDIIHLVSGAALGPNPTWDGFGAIEIAAAPGPATGPEILNLPSVAAHSSYWDAGNPALRNMGAIIAGQPPPQIVPNG
ncbi:alpha/beta hydrolase [Mycobacterium sp. CVI_P3]|uniref:Alpha/beta hydrolase n=1 Tax=Mycobacterium pinniadriaticum TaxID=2994102 RepID=A0ABT3SAE5_9MYCO|nr:alpha/beta hydrolase [Mycobacterium pinniadriaticum]MCX2929871.1 alpha/beta hydrolase [Mycobacterium pinniadriaticum]MCX2936480.1 alpha/beta hydrolase [Mycobacterium pinniadriaticum]